MTYVVGFFSKLPQINAQNYDFLKLAFWAFFIKKSSFYS